MKYHFPYTSLLNYYVIDKDEILIFSESDLFNNWNANIKFPRKGYYEVSVRATDNKGIMQPMVVPGWNPSGYINNAMHRIAVTVS